MQLTIDGLVLRRHQSGQDRILTILTAEQGVMTAYANRAGTMRSKLAATTEVLCYSRFVLFKGKSGLIVDGADSNRIFFGLREDWDKLCLGSYFAQLAAELCPHGEPAAQPLRLLLNTLHYLEQGREQRQLKALLELRLLTLTGFMPNLVACADCGCYEGEGMRFFPARGELLCGSCLEGGADRAGGIPLRPGVLAAMRHILYISPEKLFSFTLGEEGLDDLCRASEQYLLCQVEKSFTALEMYNACKITRRFEEIG